MTQMVRRVTPMHIVDDVHAAGLAFEALGFERVETELPDECRGWRASNGSSVVVAARSLIARQFGKDVAARMGAPSSRMCGLVVFRARSEELAAGDHSAEVLAQTLTPYQTVEAIIRTRGGYMLLAERLG